MEITEIRIRLVDGGAERLRAFCSVTFDADFVIRDLKIIEGVNGYFVAMPSRKLSYRCPKCGSKNHLRARFCNDCGAKLAERRPPRDTSGRSKLHVDVAHPINTACRERIQKSVVEAFQAELEKAKQPGYQPAVVEDVDEFEGSQYDDLVAELKESVGQRRDRGDRGRGAGPVESTPAPAVETAEEDAESPEFFDPDATPVSEPKHAEPPRQEERGREEPRREEPRRAPEPPRRAAAPPPPRPPAPPPPPAREPAEPPGGFGEGIF